MPPPEPPRVKLGRRTQGRPTSSRIRRASSRLCARPLRALSRPISSMHCLNSSRSSALRIASALAPIRMQPCRSSTPLSCSASADVQPGLAAQGRQHGVGLLDGDDLLDELRGDRLDVGAVGHLGVGHDRGRVGVDQHDLVALLAQGLARLGARVVELAGLADDDRAGADDQDLVDVGTLGHVLSTWSVVRCPLSVVIDPGAEPSPRKTKDHGRIPDRTWIGPRTPRFVGRRRGPENFPILAVRGEIRQDVHAGSWTLLARPSCESSDAD